MRIYADLRCLQDCRFAFRGVGRIAASLLRLARPALPGVAEVVGILDEQMPALPEEYRALADRVQSCLSPRPGRAPTVFFQPSPMTHDPTPLAPILGAPGVQAVAFAHDFIPLDYEAQYLPTPSARRGYFNCLAWLKFYDSFAANSHYTARRLREVLGVPAGRVTVAGGTVSDTFFDPRAGADLPLACRFAPRQYILAPCGNDRRKNADAVLLAHARLGVTGGGPPGVVVLGHYTADERERLAALYLAAGGVAGGLEFVEGVSDAGLANLYRQALVTVCPSRYEGFSLPIPEALAAGCPVLASDCEAQRELVEQPEARFAPDDHGRLAELLERTWREPGWRDGLLAGQRPVAARFAEGEVARRFWHHALAGLEAAGPAPAVLRRRKPRLAVLSPYPPDRSGVAVYTDHSLQSLARHADLDVFTDAEGVEPRPYVRRFAPLTEQPYLSGAYDRVLAVVGNSHFHTRIIDYHCRYGGACLAHDNRLAELYNWWRGPERFAAMATRALGRPVDVAEAQSWLHDGSNLPWTFFDEILVKADPLVVHSRGIQAHLLKAYGRHADYLPFCCYRHFTGEELGEASRQEARRRLGIPPGRLALITLGIVAAPKAPLECVWALEQLHAWGVPADLYFVGSDKYYKAQILDLAARLRVAGRVHLLGDWVSDETYRDFILAADYAIQLRTHCFGGLSGAVLDCISAGLPSVVNQDMAEAMDGPDYVLRVPDNLSPTLIAEQIALAQEAGRHRVRASPERDAYVREHSFDNYAVQMMRVLEVA